jgi:sec-independent protein translocase protein TatA
MGLPNIGPLELIIILAIALLIVGPGRLPEMGNAIGRTIREFRKASSDMTDATKLDAQPQPAAQPLAPLPAAQAAPSAQPAPQSAPLAPNTLSNQVEPNVVAPPTPAPADRPATPGDTTGGG